MYDNSLASTGVWYIAVSSWCEVKSNCSSRASGGCGDELEQVEGTVRLPCISCMGLTGTTWVSGGVSVCNDTKIE